MRPEFTPSVYDYYMIREYRKGNNMNYYQYRFITPDKRNKIVSYETRWSLAEKLYDMGAELVDNYTIRKPNNRFIDVKIYRYYRLDKLDKKGD